MADRDAIDRSIDCATELEPDERAKVWWLKIVRVHFPSKEIDLDPLGEDCPFSGREKKTFFE